MLLDIYFNIKRNTERVGLLRPPWRPPPRRWSPLQGVAPTRRTYFKPREERAGAELSLPPLANPQRKSFAPLWSVIRGLNPRPPTFVYNFCPSPRVQNGAEPEDARGDAAFASPPILNLIIDLFDHRVGAACAVGTYIRRFPAILLQAHVRIIPNPFFLARNAAGLQILPTTHTSLKRRDDPPGRRI